MKHLLLLALPTPQYVFRAFTTQFTASVISAIIVYMDRAIWYRKLKLSEAEKAERDYYSSLTIEQKLDMMQELRETIEKFGNESRKRLRRVLKIIKQE